MSEANDMTGGGEPRRARPLRALTRKKISEFAARDPGLALSAPRDDALIVRQFSTRLPSGLSSEKVGTSISKRSPLSLTI